MVVFWALLSTLIAGVINGSFALPTKYVKKWNFENIWLLFAFWTFLVAPWAFLLYLNPNALEIYQSAPKETITTLILGGVFFGIGQIGFALALSYIGIGLAFVINISLSTALGALVPLFLIHTKHSWDPDSFVTLLGIIIIITGLIISYLAGRRRDQLMEVEKITHKKYALGVFAAIIAGLGSAGQNYSFASTTNMQELALSAGLHPLAASFIIWPGFLTAAFVPYALYMLFFNFKNKSFSVYFTGEKRFYLYALIMAIFWFGSLVFYSKATQLIGNLGPVVIWPLFMTLIILTSNFWGWQSGEWKVADRKTKALAFAGIVFFILAVIVFGIAANLSQGK